MSERVTLQYSIDLSCLPAEVARLVSNAREELVRLCDLPFSGPDSLLSLETLEQIDHLRQELAKIDRNWEDISHIVNGYITYKVGEITQPVPESLEQLNSTLDQLETVAFPGDRSEISD